MAMNPQVSVIVPTYNRRDMLREAVVSVLGQRDVAMELIIVDDGSTDGTWEELHYGELERMLRPAQENCRVVTDRTFAPSPVQGNPRPRRRAPPRRTGGVTVVLGSLVSKPDYSAALATRMAISAPCACSATLKSCWVCKFIQNWAELPKYLASLSAVSGEIDRLPLRISTMRPDGTPRSNARRLALSRRATSSSLNISPGCVLILAMSTLVIIYDFDVVCAIILKTKHQTPTAVNGNGPMTAATAL
jgi:Glycosyl transferase family 2